MRSYLSLIFLLIISLVTSSYLFLLSLSNVFSYNVSIIKTIISFRHNIYLLYYIYIIILYKYYIIYNIRYNIFLIFILQIYENIFGFTNIFVYLWYRIIYLKLTYMISINNFDGQIIDTGETNVYKEEEIVEIKIPKKSTPDDTITDIISLLSKLNKSETIVFKYLFNKTCMNFAPNHLNEINTIVRLDYNLFDDMKANYNISERNTRSAVESLCKKRLMFKPIDGKGRRILGCVSISNAILCTNITKGTAGAIIIKY